MAHTHTQEMPPIIRWLGYPILWRLSIPLFFFACILLTGTLLAQEKPILVIDAQGHSAMIKDVIFSADGKTLISIGDDKTIRLWNPTNGTLRNTLRGQIGEGNLGKLNAAALSPDGVLLAVAGFLAKDEIRIIHLPTNKQVATLYGHSNVVTDLDFSGDGRWLASASGDKTVRIWSIPMLGTGGKFTEPPKEVSKLEGHTQPVYGVSFFPNGRKVVSASFDGTLRLHYLTANGTPDLASKPMIRHEGQVYCVDVSPDGQYIASGGLDGKIYLWDSDGNFYNTIEDLGDEIFTLSFSYELNKLVAMTAKGSVYEIPFGLTLGKFNEHNNTVRASAFAPVRTEGGAEIIATAGGSDNEIFVWNAEDGEVLQKMSGAGKSVWSVAFGDGVQIAFGNSFAKDDNTNRGPLEKTFDFAQMKLGTQKPDETKFRRAKINLTGRTLRLKDENTLILGNGKEIQNTAATGRSIRSYTFTPKGDIVVGSSGSLRMYDTNGQFIREFVGHTAEVWAVAVSDDGRYLVSASNDQTIRLWNPETGENLASLFVGTDQEWVCWTPKGYYDASAGGEKYIGWHVNKGPDQLADYYPASSFRKTYFLPDLVKLTVDTRSFQQALTFYGKAVGTEVVVVENVVNDSKPPVIEWLSPEQQTTSSSANQLRIRAKVTSALPITSVKVLVDGRPLAKERGFKVEKKDTPNQKWIEVDVPLINQETKVQIFASNEKAQVLSEDRIIRYKNSLTTASADDELNFDVLDYIAKPNLYLLTIGVSDFKNPDWNLNFADDDAKAIARVYGRRQEKIFNQVFTKQLLDGQATKANILDAFNWLKSKATERDMVVIFVASHGFNDKNQFYILPHDGDPAQLEKTCVNWKDFSSTLGTLPSKVLLFLDACHSGQLGVNMATANNTEALRNLSSAEYGVVIMSASTGDEPSWEDPAWGHGAFTYALLEGIEKGMADLKPDKVIYLRELDFFVADKVNELTKGKQNPTTQKPSTITSMPVATLE